METLPFGCVSNTHGLMPYQLSPFIPPYQGQACFSMPPTTYHHPPRTCSPVQYSYGCNVFDVGNKENMRTVYLLKELQMTRHEIYQALMIHVLRSADKERFGFPTEDINEPGKAVISNRPVCDGNPEDKKTCCRCKQLFAYTEDLQNMGPESFCSFHWGKLFHGVDSDIYTCCGKAKGSKGCKRSRYHVSSSIDVKSGPRFVKTKAPREKSQFDIFALDCEMCYTTRGLSLTKVSLVALDGYVVYDSYVLPTDPILDYNTRYSGVTSDDLLYCNKTLEDVQVDLLRIINSGTILIGHGLENDLKALRIIHSMVIDTSVVFPHHKGFPYRRSLKHLASSILFKDIQLNERYGLGHSSIEDSRTCVELMLWKLKQDKQQDNKNLFTYDPFDS